MPATKTPIATAATIAMKLSDPDLDDERAGTTGACGAAEGWIGMIACGCEMRFGGPRLGEEAGATGVW